MSTQATYQEPGPCSCGAVSCDVVGTKLQKALPGEINQHLVGCRCRPHIGRRNRRKGQAGEAKAHRALGGIGPTIRDDLFHAYSINIALETKSGNQVPARLIAAVRSEFMRHAFAQAAKKTPVGADAFPAVMLQPHGGGQYLIVDVSGRSLR